MTELHQNLINGEWVPAASGEVSVYLLGDWPARLGIVLASLLSAWALWRLLAPDALWMRRGVVLEPSAGTGSLIRTALLSERKQRGRAVPRVHANELDGFRGSVLRHVLSPGASITAADRAAPWRDRHPCR